MEKPKKPFTQSYHFPNSPQNPNKAEGWFSKDFLVVAKVARIKRKPRPPPSPSLMTRITVNKLKTKICHR